MIQNTPIAIPDSTCTGWPVLSSMRALTFSMARIRRVNARAMTATSQPTIRMASAARISGSVVPSVF